MFTVDQHNEERRAARVAREEAARKTDVACPKCSQELEWEPIWIQHSIYPLPTTRPARCPKCGLTIQLET